MRPRGQLRVAAEIVMSHSPSSKNMSMETEESPNHYQATTREDYNRL
jgi:hypothetical protein